MLVGLEAERVHVDTSSGLGLDVLEGLNLGEVRAASHGEAVVAVEL